ncbi:YwdI family protein [Alkalibacillus aidingensis]|uniref:YwdI family protein n=1 Tax=Alkalibacillus aidingensis TaxID=2747607 RepID=UPI001660DDB9|nr:YwdI family protein [Alkalibacillus aidingensis]
MSVSHQAIIAKMKEELQALDASSNEAEVKAKVYAIRSLADLILATEEKQSDQNLNKQVANTPPTTDITDVEARMMGIKVPKKPSTEPNILEEDDANGDSIFDF